MSWLKDTFRGWRTMAQPAPMDDDHLPLEEQRLQDLSARIRSGILFYPVVWLLIGGIMLIYRPSLDKLILTIAILALEVAVTGFRFYLLNQCTRYTEFDQVKLFRCTDVGVTLSALGWSAILLSSLLNTPFKEHFSLIITTTLALSSGALVNLSIRKQAVRYFLIALYTPSIIVLCLGWSNQPSGLGLVFLFYCLVMNSLTRLPRREYERAALSNLQLQEQARQLTELSNNDALTGLRNRRYFESTLKQECSRASRLEYPVSLLIIDIDFFKTINDQYGHMVGDQCLRHLSRLIKQEFLRAQDTVARIGGEEFAVILPGMKAEDAMALAETLRASVYDQPFDYEGTRNVVSISVGCTASSLPHEHSPASLMKHADQALYLSKSKGRNQVSFIETSQ